MDKRTYLFFNKVTDLYKDFLSIVYKEQDSYLYDSYLIDVCTLYIDYILIILSQVVSYNCGILCDEDGDTTCFIDGYNENKINFYIGRLNDILRCIIDKIYQESFYYVPYLGDTYFDKGNFIIIQTVEIMSYLASIQSNVLDFRVESKSSS